MNDISQAELLGINLDELELESPDHPRQVGIGIRHRAKAREYWEWKKLELLVEADALENYGEEAVR